MKEGPVEVGSVEIKNRLECCDFARLQNVKIYVDETFCGQAPELTEKGKWYRISCLPNNNGAGIMGNFVKIFNHLDQPLTLCGVKVHSPNYTRKGKIIIKDD